MLFASIFRFESGFTRGYSLSTCITN